MPIMRNQQHPLQGYACRITHAPKNVEFGMVTGEYFVIGRVESKGSGSHYKVLFLDDNDPRTGQLYELDGGKFTWVRADEIGKSFVSEQYPDVPNGQDGPMCRSLKPLLHSAGSSIDGAAKKKMSRASTGTKVGSAEYHKMPLSVARLQDSLASGPGDPAPSAKHDSTALSLPRKRGLRAPAKISPHCSKRKRSTATSKKHVIFTMEILYERGIECSNCSRAIPQKQVGMKNDDRKLFICFRCFYDVKQGLVFSQCVAAKGHDPPTHNIPDVVESGHRADNDNVHCDLIDMSNVWHLSVKKMKANGQLFGACNSIVAFSAFDGIGAGLVALVRLQIPVRVYITSELTSQEELLAFAKRFGIVVIQLGDVHSIEKNHIKMIEERFNKVHLYMGGPPCQKTASVNTGNTDRTPTKEFAQFVTILKWFKSAPFVLVETLASSGHKETVDLMFEPFEQFGCTKKVIDAKLVSPLRRCRSYFTNIRQTRPIVQSPVGMADIIKTGPSLMVGKGSQKPSWYNVSASRRDDDKGLTLMATKQTNWYPTLDSGNVERVYLHIEDAAIAMGFEREFFTNKDLHHRLQKTPCLLKRYVNNNDETGSAFFKIGNSWSVPVIMQLLSPLCELFDRVNYSIAPLEWNWYPLTRQVPTAPEGLGEHVAFGRDISTNTNGTTSPSNARGDRMMRNKETSVGQD